MKCYLMPSGNIVYPAPVYLDGLNIIGEGFDVALPGSPDWKARKAHAEPVPESLREEAERIEAEVLEDRRRT